jgi:polyisoprenoid-binding protein YceI
MNKFLRTTGVFVSFGLFTALAAAKVSGASGSSVVFKATGPAGLNIEGKTSTLNVKEDGDTVTFTVPLNTVKTGIALRDEHMCKDKALDCAKHPTAELKIKRADIKLEDGKETSGEAPGKMTLHGQTKDVKVKYKVKKAGGDVTVDANTTIKYTDYGIQKAEYLGAEVKPDVTLKVTSTLKDS